MRFTTRTKYGLRFLIRLATQKPGCRLSLREAADAENISAGYLEQIARSLKPLGILQGARGNGGGYRLARDPKDISLEEIIGSLEGDLSPVDCLAADRECGNEAVCRARRFWEEFDRHNRSFLRARSLGDICGPVE